MDIQNAIVCWNFSHVLFNNILLQFALEYLIAAPMVLALEMEHVNVMMVSLVQIAHLVTSIIMDTLNAVVCIFFSFFFFLFFLLQSFAHFNSMQIA